MNSAAGAGPSSPAAAAAPPAPAAPMSHCTVSGTGVTACCSGGSLWSLYLVG
jgi:hypothetical protein